MVRATAVLLVLSLALVAHRLTAKKCVLTGKWINDLGSNMTIRDVNKEGVFNGTYYTAVKNTPNAITISPLLGYKNLANANGQPIFGFTVNWNFTDSITVFVGQCFVDGTGKEVLRTTWLLRSHANNISNDWNATSVGTNIFKRKISQCE